MRCRRRIFEIYVVYLLTIVSKLCLAYSVAFRDSFDTFAFGGSFEINELYSGVVRELRYIACMAELDDDDDDDDKIIKITNGHFPSSGCERIPHRV